ncbi:MAG: signal peptide peptidase SppA [Oscillospiraceae bacterium]|nr:signal peptide peptidase SppA [Oscillospiraceae bacterium]
MKTKQVIGIIVAAVVFVAVGVTGVYSAVSAREKAAALFSEAQSAGSDMPAGDSIALVRITGTIGETTYDALGNVTSSYDHERILQLIEDMRDSDANKGLLLVVDSPGGTVYHSDEVYLALMDYKQQTGRPVWAFCGQQMASGAYYISCAADKIYANRNASVGSIGVYMQTVNFAGLFDKLGINGEFIRSSDNKAMGNMFDELTDEQRAILQSQVDECYDQFLGIVCEARGYTRDELLPIADGRSYTAKQAKENGLIDDVRFYDDVLADFESTCGVDEAYDRTYTVNPVLSLLSKLEAALPKSETASALELVKQSESGVLMYYAG